jgi:hypothetical protein
MNKVILKRFNEIGKDIQLIESTKYIQKKHFARSTLTYKYVDNDIFIKWKVQVKDLIVKLTNTESEYYKEFIKIENQENPTNYTKFIGLKGIFVAVKNDYTDGYLSSIKTLIQAEVFESQLEQSQELLDSGYKLASAVIAGIVLETGLREICIREEISQGKLDKMNADLAKKGVYNKLQQKRITALADIRNSAAHGKEEEFTKDDVVNMIREVEQFLANNLDSI